MINRRDILTAGVGLVTLGTLNQALAGRPCPPSLSGVQAAVCPPPVGAARWEWNVPSLQDETDFYTNVMGWTIPSGANNFTTNAPGNKSWLSADGWSFGNLHGDGEGDELWTWDQQLKRYGNVSVGGGSTTQDWYNELLAKHKANLLSKLDLDEAPGKPGVGFGYDHLYAQGLATIYNDTLDSTILPVLSGIRTRLEGVSQYQSLAAGGNLAVATWEGRGVARWTIAAAYAAEATGDPAWQTVRNNLVRAYETSPDWEEGGVIRNGGGNFFASRAQSQFTSGSGGTAAYDGGRRFHSAFQTGLVAEAMWRCYVQTGSTILKDRLIKIARYLQHYAHDPTWMFPNVGSRHGHEGNGDHWHGASGDGSASNAAKDCSYDMSLVNAMVIGYKLTGDTSLLEFARTLFARGGRYNPGSPYELWAQSLDHVVKYVDTVPNPSQRRFQWNKGQLQYCYMIFENGGNPSVLP